MYIYNISNNVNNKIYIGKSEKDVDSTTNYFGSGITIRRAIEKHGIENFDKHIILDNINNKALLNELERHYIRLYNSNNINVGYNLTAGGDGFAGAHTDESKAKISKNHKCRQEGFVHPFKGTKGVANGPKRKVSFEGKEFASLSSASKYFKIPLSTFCRILDTGLSLAEYRKTRAYNWDKRKPVLEIETGKIYESSAEMGRQLNIHQVGAARIARQERKHNSLTYKYL